MKKNHRRIICTGIATAIGDVTVSTGRGVISA